MSIFRAHLVFRSLNLSVDMSMAGLSTPEMQMIAARDWTGADRPWRTCPLYRQDRLCAGHPASRGLRAYVRHDLRGTETSAAT